MNRRNLLKTAGLAIAGSALMPFDTFAKTSMNYKNLRNN